jgi:VanZ family protein
MKLNFILSIYWKSILIVAGILYLSFAPPSTFKGIPAFEFEDKLVHLLMYGGLSFFLIFDFQRHTKNNPMSGLAFSLICLFIPVFLGGIVEIMQPLYFSPRTAEWFDWFSDISGVLLGWLASSIIKPILVKVKIK